MIAKDPAARFPDYEELLEALGATAPRPPERAPFGPRVLAALLDMILLSAPSLLADEFMPPGLAERVLAGGGRQPRGDRAGRVRVALGGHARHVAVAPPGDPARGWSHRLAPIPACVRGSSIPPSSGARSARPSRRWAGRIG